MLLCEGTTNKAKTNARTADREKLHEEFGAFVVDKRSKDSKLVLRGLSEVQEGIAGLEQSRGKATPINFVSKGAAFARLCDDKAHYVCVHMDPQVARDTLKIGGQ